MPKPKPTVYPIPEVARTLMGYIDREYQEKVSAVGNDVVAQLGLSGETHDIRVDFRVGTVTVAPKVAKEAKPIVPAKAAKRARR